MRHSVLLVAILVAACVPAAVQPTLQDVGSLGYTCGDGTPDGEPSGLYQWHCTGTVAGKLAVIDVDGNDQGVAEIMLSIDSPDPSGIRAEFHRVASGVIPLKIAPLLGEALAAWSGEQEATSLGNARVSSQCDPTQCEVDVTAIDGPLTPLRLP
jgi:hypothetical protein